jgi:hypothetical protein
VFVCSLRRRPCWMFDGWFRNHLNFKLVRGSPAPQARRPDG